MTCQYPVLCGDSDWPCRIGNLFNQSETLPTWVVTRHQYGISALVSETSFCGETSDGVTKCRLFFPGYLLADLIPLSARRCYYSGDLSLELLLVMLWSCIFSEQDCCFDWNLKNQATFYIFSNSSNTSLKQKIACKKYNELWALFDFNSL